MVSPLETNPCPAGNTCELSEPAAPACGTAPEHLPPVLAAEALCPRALADRISMTRQGIAGCETGETANPGRSALLHRNLAWLLFERGMATPQDDAAPYQAEGREHVRAALEYPYARFDEMFSAALLAIYSPAFSAGRERTRTTPTTIRHIRGELGALYDLVEATPIHSGVHLRDAKESGEPHTQCISQESERIGMQAKLVGLMLAARNGTLLYPASIREGRAAGSLKKQNHHAYTLDGGQKTAYAFHARSGQQARHRIHQVVEGSSIHSINILSLIEGSLRDIEDQYPDYPRSLSRSVSLPTVGRLLQMEMSESIRLNVWHRRLLDALSTRFQQILEGPSSTAARHGSQNLPAVGAPNSAAPEYRADPRSERAARAAEEHYLEYGNTTPTADQLRRLASNMEHSNSTRIRTTCATAYVDLARIEQRQDVTHSLIALDAGRRLARSIAERDWAAVDPEEVSDIFRCGLLLTYMPRYRQVLSRESIDAQDETSLYLNLLRLGEQTLAPCLSLPPGKELRRVRGTQFEIGVHLLLARYNAMSGSSRFHTWPSLARQDRPRQHNSGRRTGWDACLTNAGFLLEGPDSRYLQLKNIDDSGAEYDPAITVIIGDRDLGTSSAADIIEVASRELHATPLLKQAARQRLDTFTAALLRTVGYL